MMNEPDATETLREKPELEVSPSLLGYDQIHFLLSVEGIPDELKRTFWAWVNPLPALSNLRIEDVNRVLGGYMLDAEFYVQRLREARTKITFRLLQWINQTYFCLFMNLMRSVGDERERKLIATSYRVSRGTYEERTPQQKGRLSRLFGG